MTDRSDEIRVCKCGHPDCGHQAGGRGYCNVSTCACVCFVFGYVETDRVLDAQAAVTLALLDSGLLVGQLLYEANALPELQPLAQGLRALAEALEDARRNPTTERGNPDADPSDQSRR